MSMLGFLKKIVKKVLPAAFLKEAYLNYNKIKIKTIDRLLFPEYKIDKDAFKLYREGYPFRESKISLDDIEEGEVKRYMQSWYNWTQEEFILVFDKSCIIEPRVGWAITGFNRLIYYSLGVSRTLFLPKPSFLPFIMKSNVLHLKSAISLRDTGEENYFHFFNDVISKLTFLQTHGFHVEATPIIISSRLREKRYFQFFLDSSPFLGRLKWVVQSPEMYVKCDSAIFCKPLTHKMELWERIIFPNRTANTKNESRRVFLTRNKARLRFIENILEIENVVKEFGFEVIDTDNLSPEEQFNTFQQVGYLVGIHGAGLTNMIFRNGKCAVIEIFSPPDLGYLPYHYIMLAKLSGFGYNAIIGKRGRLKYSGGFYVNPDELRNSLRKLEF